jgi:hypothetical protein
MPRPIILASLAAAAALTLTAAAPAAAVTPTTVKRVSALDADGELNAGWRVNDRYDDSECWTWGFGEGAYQCMTDDSYIYDPCYEAAPAEDGTDRVVCMLAPWRKTVTELLLPFGYDTEPNPNRGGPFAGLTLAGGWRCQWLSGGTGVIGNKRINYGCPGGRYLAGNPSRRTKRWKIQEARYSGGQFLKTGKIAVRVAWRYRAG